jgi:hypothetical protein
MRSLIILLTKYEKMEPERPLEELKQKKPANGIGYEHSNLKNSNRRRIYGGKFI